MNLFKINHIKSYKLIRYYLIFVFSTSAYLGFGNELTFFDNFEGSNTSEYNWMKFGNWKERNGAFYQDNINKFHGAYTGNLIWKNYTFSVKARTRQSLIQESVSSVAEVAFRVTSGQNMYVLKLLKNGRLKLNSILDGTHIPVADVWLDNKSPFIEHEFKIELDGDRIKVFVDQSSNPMIDILNDDHSRGVIGLRTSQCTAVFDDVMVDLEPTVEDPKPEPTPDPTTPYIAHENISYGNHNRQKYDVFEVHSDEPTALLVYIHGGGFIQGDKSGFKGIENYTKSGVAVARINYRYSNQNNQGILGCMKDSMRALQHIRYHADIYNIDKNRIILKGSSAGAGTSLWLALNNDMAKPWSGDPIARESTRVSGVIATQTQSTYNFTRWNALLNFNNYKSEKSIDKIIMAKPRSFFKNMDMLDMLTSDDPPIYVDNPQSENMFMKDDGYHHPLHARALYEKAIRVNLPFHYIYAQAIDLQPSIEISQKEFVLTFN